MINYITLMLVNMVAVNNRLRMVGLAGIAARYPNKLSGGMQKQVSFARAVMSNPDLLHIWRGLETWWNL